METQRIIRLNAILLCVVVILMVTVAFIFDKTTIPKETENVVTASLASKPHTVEVTTPSSISYQTASGSVISATSSSISAKEKRQKEKMRKKKIKEQRRKKRLQQKKRAERKRLLEQKKAQRKLTEAETYSYTHQELLTLAKIIWAEARGESYKGKVSVGAVAMNRLNTKSSEFGAENGSLMEVLLKKWAFADISDLSDEEFKNSDYYDDCIKAALAALAGEDPTKEYFQNGALFFYDIYMDISEKQKRYREGIDTYKIGCHAFHVELND